MRGFRVWSNYWEKFAIEAELHMDGSVDAIFEDDDGVPHHENTDLVVEFDTGLKDKNGKEIREGDIVLWSFKVDRNSELTYTADAVKWESYAEEEWPYSTISGFTLSESEDGYVVIGNIHENSELLEGGEWATD